MVDVGAILGGRAFPGLVAAATVAVTTLLLPGPASGQGAGQVASAGPGIGLTSGPASTGVGSQFEMVFWQSIDSGNDPALYEAYLGRYPDGTFASVARVKIAKLRQLSGGAAAPVLAPQSPPAALGAVPVPPPAAAPAPPAMPERNVPTALAVRPAASPAPVPASVSAPVAATARAVPAPAPGAALAVVAPSRVEAAANDSVTDSAALRRLLGVLGDSQRVPDAAPLALSPALPPSAPASAPVSPALPALAANGAVPASDAKPIAVGALPASFVLPSKPALEAVPGLALPLSFCSAEARNQFHDTAYIPAVAAAKRINDAAISYLHQLQDVYDRNQLTGDINPMNAVAAEARAWGPAAAAAFSAQSALVGAFGALMAVPITPCEAPN